MNKKLVTISLTLFFVFNVITSPKADETWRENMQKLAAVLSDLLPKVASEKEFNNPNNKASLDADINTLSHLSHGLAKPGTMMALPPDADPSIPLIMGTLEDEINQAKMAYEQGHKEYSRNLFKNITGYCVTCHTRTNQGVNQRILDIKPNLSALTSFEMAEYLTAMRRFDDAFAAYEKIVKDHGQAKNNAYAWEKALKNALAISVRYKRDPERSLKIINLALQEPSLSPDFKINLARWQKGADDWKNEPAESDVKPAALKEKINKLLASGKLAQKNPADDAALIQYLRISSLAHDWLGMVTGALAADPLYYVGIAHSALQEGPIFFMPEMYFDACIKKSPHSDIAKKCYDSYFKTTKYNFTGSSGTVLPEGVQEQMGKLKALAY